MSKEVVVYQDGPGAKITRRVSVEQLSELDDSWSIKASPSEIVELQEEANVSPNEEMAEQAAKAFERRSKNSGSQVMAELAEDIREENGIPDTSNDDWKDNETWTQYKKRKRSELRNQESRAKTEELSQAPSGESKSDKIARLKSARDAFRNRGKIGESANEWGEIAKDIEKEIEALESGSTNTSELSEDNEGNVRTIDGGSTSIHEIDNMAEIQSRDPQTIEALRDFADKHPDLINIDSTSSDSFVLATTSKLHQVRSEVAGL